MTRTVDDPILVPATYAFALTEVADELGDGGLNRMYRCVNTLYEQSRGQLINDCSPFFRSGDIIIDTIGEVARYRVRRFGTPGLGTNNPLIEVWAYMRIVHTNTDSVTMRATTVMGGDSGTAAANVTGSGTTNSWFGPISGVAMSEDPADVYEQIEFDITAAGGNITSFHVATVMARYEADLSALPAGDYTGDPFVPLEVSQAAGEKPVSTARLHHLHGNLRNLYESRGSGMVVASAFPKSSQYPEDWFAMVQVPEGVTQLRCYFRLGSAVGSPPGAGFPWGKLSTSDDVIQFNGTAPVGTWSAAQDLDVTPGTRQQIRFITSSFGGSYTTKFSEFSCWLRDGDYDL
jgi:hypothetical protein